MKDNKLVRDKIPEIIESKGKTAIIHIASTKEYDKRLKDKLQEEVSEFIEEDNKEEFADILEVMDAIGNFKKFKREDILSIKNKKAEERGKFCKKIVLDKVK